MPKLKYRKIPVVIEAIQFTDSTDNLAELANWMGECTISHTKPEPFLKIPTLEGVMQASIGDYIIKGVNGEFYPCKPDIFLKTYEPIENENE